MLLLLTLVLAAVLSLAACTAQIPPDAWRDLNRNGELDAYENSSLPIDERVSDLLSRMTLEEKVGTLLHGTLPAVDSPIGVSSVGYDLQAFERLVTERSMSSFVTGLKMPPKDLAEMNNAVQRIAANSRLGIPATISSDPRHHFLQLVGASTNASGFSTWPETLGMAAMGDVERVRTFGDIARQEYRAVGIHMALSPQADLGTEPRWPRIFASFGSDAATVSELSGAYIEGFQGSKSGVTAQGVATVVKHWVGYAAAPSGFDAHNYYGRTVGLDEHSLTAHIKAFGGAFAANAAGVMPSYAMMEDVKLGDRPVEPVGGGFSKVLLQTVLREQHGFKGFVLSDWGILKDCPESCRAPTAQNPQTPATIGMPWGVESLSVAQRAARALAAGVDQFGGLDDPEPVLNAIKAKQVSQARIDEAVARVLQLKFALGLFDNPFVDPEAADAIVGSDAFVATANAAQRSALVLLKNHKQILPLAETSQKVWLWGVNEAAAEAYGFDVVASPELAEVAIVRGSTPAEMLHPHHFFGRLQAEGRLDFRIGDEAYDAIARAAASTPVIVGVDMDRPAVLTNINGLASGLFAIFGASDEAFLDVITGKAAPLGRLPLNLPSSMQAVQAQDPGRPDDDADPLYPRGYGLFYQSVDQQ